MRSRTKMKRRVKKRNALQNYAFFAKHTNELSPFSGLSDNCQTNDDSFLITSLSSKANNGTDQDIAPCLLHFEYFALLDFF
ncbi:MAG: hypothetical protein EAZ92_01890 [Candidatus Kapaibacterium sp.]|nr:MAG: hypothetical protein EAZ92_01890 [Candidatus Kapabacteria bacterium]